MRDVVGEARRRMNGLTRCPNNKVGRPVRCGRERGPDAADIQSEQFALLLVLPQWALLISRRSDHKGKYQYIPAMERCLGQ